LRAEHHVHLYGCLDAQDLWRIGRDRFVHCSDRLGWYASEYKRLTGTIVDWRRYWISSSGFEELEDDFLFQTPASFRAFQARFNLVIALCKIYPEDSSVLRYVLEKYIRQGFRYVEIRVVIPSYIRGRAVGCYFSTLAEEILRTERACSGAFVPRLALSLPRESTLTMWAYRIFRRWLATNPEKARAFSAVDLSSYEENDPPKKKQFLVRKVLEDNYRYKKRLSILYHVGESFLTLSIASSVRWIWEVFRMGVSRIGHAISLGLDPIALQGQKTTETVAERLDHLAWLLSEKAWLRSYGYAIDLYRLKQERRDLQNQSPEARLPIVYNQEYIEDFACLQAVLRRGMLDHQLPPVIESCPTSNLLIAGITQLAHHPLKCFIDEKFPLCICTDNPGILSTDLCKEVDFVLEKLFVDKQAIQNISSQEMRYCSEKLAR